MRTASSLLFWVQFWTISTRVNKKYYSNYPKHLRPAVWGISCCGTLCSESLSNVGQKHLLLWETIFFNYLWILNGFCVLFYIYLLLIARDFFYCRFLCGHCLRSLWAMQINNGWSIGSWFNVLWRIWLIHHTKFYYTWFSIWKPNTISINIHGHRSAWLSLHLS